MKRNTFYEKLSREAEQIMMDRFGKDTVIALATAENEMPYVRSVNVYYKDGAFDIITYALSLPNGSTTDIITFQIRER